MQRTVASCLQYLCISVCNLSVHTIFELCKKLICIHQVLYLYISEGYGPWLHVRDAVAYERTTP